MAQAKLQGVKWVERMFVFKAAAYNLIRLPRLLATGCVCPESAQGRISGLGAAGKPLKIALRNVNRRQIQSKSVLEAAFSAAC
jgi:hypothetical protein